MLTRGVARPLFPMESIMKRPAKKPTDGRMNRGQALTDKTASGIRKRLATDPKNSEAGIVKDGKQFGDWNKTSAAYNRVNKSTNTIKGSAYMYNPKKKK